MALGTHKAGISSGIYVWGLYVVGEKFLRTKAFDFLVISWAIRGRYVGDRWAIGGRYFLGLSWVFLGTSWVFVPVSWGNYSIVISMANVRDINFMRVG